MYPDESSSGIQVIVKKHLESNLPHRPCHRYDGKYRKTLSDGILHNIRLSTGLTF